MSDPVLEHRLETSNELRDELRRELTKTSKQLSSLRAWVVLYAKHAPHCSSHDKPGVCSCGLAELI